MIIPKSKLGKVAAILSDFDGTLCPTSDIGCGYYNDSAMIPQTLGDVLNKISLTIPIGIVTSKDFDFIYPKTKKFAKILSCVLGLETFVVNKNEQANQDKNFLKDNESDLGAITLRDDYSFLVHEILEINSAILTETAAYLEKNHREFNIEKKFLKSKKDLLGGITVNWRHDSDWNRNKKIYKEIVKDSISTASKNPQRKADSNISKEKLDCYVSCLFIQEYSTHPFIDVYITKVSKGDAFEVVVSKLSQFSDITGQIMYLGDSENDNPAFRKSDVSIGVSSDDRLDPRLDCTYTIKFENLPSFFNRLVDNNYIFSESFLTF